MKWNMATSKREISGSQALSAASNTSAMQPEIKRTNAAVHSGGVGANVCTFWRSAGSASSPCSR